MKLGMTLPVMEPDLDREVLRSWVEAIDQGPYASLAFGDCQNAFFILAQEQAFI